MMISALVPFIFVAQSTQFTLDFFTRLKVSSISGVNAHFEQLIDWTSVPQQNIYVLDCARCVKDI